MASRSQPRTEAAANLSHLDVGVSAEEVLELRAALGDLLGMIRLDLPDEPSVEKRWRKKGPGTIYMAAIERAQKALKPSYRSWLDGRTRGWRHFEINEDGTDSFDVGRVASMLQDLHPTPEPVSKFRDQARYIVNSLAAPGLVVEQRAAMRKAQQAKVPK